MQTVQVKIRTTVVTHQYGTLSTGDILRTNTEFARHLVEDCAAADYITAPVAADASEQKPAKEKKSK